MLAEKKNNKPRNAHGSVYKKVQNYLCISSSFNYKSQDQPDKLVHITS